MSSSAPCRSLPSWLPQPLTLDYIKIVDSELQIRETHRMKCHRPSSQGTPYAAEYSTSVAQAPRNVYYNRYPNVLPYDKSRVILSTGAYLNASWVRELAGGKWTIATQAPLPETAHSFLSMFLLPVMPPRPGSTPVSPPAANRLRTIVQLTPNVEGRMTKAFPYFPKVVGEEFTWPSPSSNPSPPIRVKLLHVTSPEEEGKYPSWKHSVLSLSYEGSKDPPHLVRHLHFLVSCLPCDRRERSDTLQGMARSRCPGRHTWPSTVYAVC
jgi:protein-tyrosine phosphatase